MSIQRRHLKSLKEVIESDVVDHKIKKDLILIYETVKKEIQQKGANPHFVEDQEEL